MRVDVQDVGLIDFPDDAKPDEIASVLNKRFPKPASQSQPAPAKTPLTINPVELTAEKERSGAMAAGYEENPNDFLRAIAPTVKNVSDAVSGALFKPITDYIPQETPEQTAARYTRQFALAEQVSPDTDKTPVQPSDPPKALVGTYEGIRNLAKGFLSPVGLASFGTADLPVAAQRTVSLAFAAQMAKDSPEVARQLGTEFGKPPDQRDTGKIAQLLTEAAGTAAFTTLAAKHGLTPAKPEPIQGPATRGDILDMPPGATPPAPEPAPRQTAPVSAPGEVSLTSPRPPAPEQITADKLLSRPRGSITPDEIATMPEQEYAKLFKGKTVEGDPYQLTVDATHWALNNQDADISKLEQLRKQTVTNQAGKPDVLDRSQWFGDAIHALKQDDVGRQNIATVTGKKPSPAEPIKSTEPTVPTTGEQPSREEIGNRQISTEPATFGALKLPLGISKTQLDEMYKISPVEQEKKYGTTIPKLIEAATLKYHREQSAVPTVPMHEVFQHKGKQYQVRGYNHGRRRKDGSEPFEVPEVHPNGDVLKMRSYKSREDAEKKMGIKISFTDKVPSEPKLEQPPIRSDAEQFDLFQAPREKPADAKIVQLRRMMDTAERLYGEFVHNPRAAGIATKLNLLEQEKLKSLYGTLPQREAAPPAEQAPVQSITEPAQEDKPVQPDSPIPPDAGPVKTFNRQNVPNEIKGSTTTLKVQKQFLLAAVDKAIKELKPLKLTPAQEKLIQEGRDISGSFDREKRYGRSTEALRSPRENLNVQANSWINRMKAQLPYVTFEVPGDGVFHVIQSAHALSEFRAIVQKEFPSGKASMGKPSMGRITSAPAPALVENPDLPEIIKAVASHASEDETRLPLHQTIYSNGSEIVTTDGRRIIRVLHKGPGTVENPVRIDSTTGRSEPWNEKERSTYPEYGVVELSLKDRKFLGTADAETLWRDVLRAEMMTSERSVQVRLFRNKDGSFGTASSSPELGESAHNIQAGAKIIGAFNAQYLRDALESARKLGNAKVDLYAKDTLAPLVIRGKNYQETLMPMRLGDESGAAEFGKSTGKPAFPEPFPPAMETKWQKIREAQKIESAKEDIKDLEKELKSATSDFRRQELRERIAATKELIKKSRKAATSESRIETTGKSNDPFEMDEGDLADLLEERYGETGATGTPGQFGRRPGEFTFPNYDSFAKWMDERYAERDHEGMRLAFAEADTANKIRYIKENRGADAHKKSWVTNLATGADLPKEDPPIPRTTPRPAPNGRGSGPQPRGGGPRPPGPQPQSRPHGPPPPPRTPSLHRKFDVTALTQMFRYLGKFPVINKRLSRAYGRFIHGSNAVELKQRLFWDTKLAERVLGHEIGHFIDLAIPLIGKGKQLGERLRPMFDFKKQIGLKQELKNEARNLSRDWRGSFQNGDKYRDSAEELFADFMSAMFNNPEWVNQKYPKLYDAFQELRDAKPQFKSAYREIETWLQGDTVVNELFDQDKKAVEQTSDILTEKNDKARATFRDRLTFDMMSLWQRAFQKEGKPRQIGTSVTEKLEGSYMWAAKRLTLWHDDFIKMVQPFLDKVSDDPIDARAHLLSYSKAVRTIGERRAAGVWIESHPRAAREMLQSILNADGSLHYKFANALANTPNSGLYDLTASIFREIHDRGEKYVARIGRHIDSLNLGVDGQAALMAFNVRGKLLNPGGLTVDTAGKMIQHLRDKLGPDKFDALDKASSNLRDLMHGVQSEMHDAGLISDKIWKELIEPNANNYLPYAVLDYFDGKVRAGVMSQKGTARDVADVATSTELKVASSYLWLQKQRQVQLINEAYVRGGSPLTIGKELDRANDLERIQAQHKNDDVSRATIWVDGKPHLMEFPGDPGKLLQDALNLPEFYNHIEWLHTASKLSHQVMQLFTQLSPRFLLYRNIIRGFRTAGLKVGYIEAAKQMRPEQLRHNLALAKNYADAAFGAEMLPEVRALVSSEALPPPHVAAGAVRDLPNMRELLARGALPAFRAKQVRGNIPEQRGPISTKAQQAKNVTDKIFTAYEAFEKIYNYQAATAKGLAPETASAIAKRGGIPNPGVVGKWSSAAEILFPWTRVRIQGMRASYDMMRDPRFRKGFFARFMLTEAAPRIAKVAIGVGLIAKTVSWITGNNQNKDDSVMAEVFKRISPYKMALDDVIPTMLYDARTGKYHYFWEYKKGSDIPKHFEVVSLRIPSSEEGQTWGTMLYNAMISVPGANTALARPGEGIVENMGNWAINYLFPSPSPALQTAAQLEEMVLQGRNPTDQFRGQPAANPQLFDAGGKERAQAIAGYILNQGGGPGELAGVIAANLGILDPRALDSLKSRLGTDKRNWDEKIPFMGAAVSHDNYAEYRTEKGAEIEDKRLRANAKLVMSPDVRSLYEFYYMNNARQKQLTPAEQVQFEAAKHFVEKIWGTMTKDGKPNPNSFYAKTAHAVGSDGSNQSKETVKRDLDRAAAIDLIVFQRARQNR